MPKPFLALSVEQFVDLLQQFPWRRQVTEVHVHHTWRPNHANFSSRPPVQTIEAMWRFHTAERGFIDIAQHVTIDPEGTIWTGRNWNTAPASATGFNGNSVKGPFMFEMIGNFDEDNDKWEGAQQAAAIEVIAQVQRRFGLPPEAFRFHREMSEKSCPGTGIQKDDVLEAVRAAHKRLDAPRARSRGAFAAEASELRAGTERLLELLGASAGSRGLVMETEPPESEMSMREAALSAGDSAAASRMERARAADGGELSPDDKAFLRPHAINLRMGAFSSGGEFQTSPEDVDAIFNEHLPRELETRVKQGRKLKLVFFAHGGLNDEKEGVRNALNRIQFYLDNNCYPIFFIWETGPKETLVDILRGIIGLSPARGITDTLVNLSDAGLESAFRQTGFSMWANMKRSAELSFLPKQGGAFLAGKLVEFWGQHHDNMEIHAIGHSAGSIFHAYFLDHLCQSAANPAVEVKTLHFLAPAITVDLFKEKLLPLAGKQVKGLTEYTMHKDFELADSVGPYRKSLLYLVSRSFEDQPETKILGLEESIRRDADLVRFFGLAGGKKPVGEILFSVQDAGPRNSTIARTHGDFDNDRLTMSGVIRRILDIPDTDPIVEFPETVSRTVLNEVLPATPAAAPDSPAEPYLKTAASGSRRALCIGIDAYPPGNQLSGCVNDANDWAASFESLGFQTARLLNQDATFRNIQDRLKDLVGGAKPGDVIAVQYAGHGTLVPDLDGDENGAKDSALCPVDFPSGGFIIDDDIRAIFRVLPEGVNLTCFFDCCHSGTITRLIGPTPAGQNVDVRARFIVATPEMEEAHRRFRAALGFRTPAPRDTSAMKEVSFTACTDAQVALEMSGHGQFTVRALGVLRQGGQGLTNEQFYQKVLAAFGGSAAQQTPQLDCAPGSKARSLLAAIAGGSASPTPATGMDAVMARLDRIEQRLSKLGG